jgi:SOS-response transcriptional repressor LexA
MMSLIRYGFVVAVDASETDVTKLDGKIVIASHKDMGLVISRFHRFDLTEVLQSESVPYQAITLSADRSWKIVATVL